MKRPRLGAVGLAAALSLSISCATGPKFEKLLSGMSRDEVVESLGEPDTISAESRTGGETYRYSDRAKSDWTSGEADYFVRFDKDGKLVEKGQENVVANEYANALRDQRLAESLQALNESLQQSLQRQQPGQAYSYPHSWLGTGRGAPWTHSGCCSYHGGVAGCNTFAGKQICRDGTLSPTCRCMVLPDGRIVDPED